MLMAQEPAPAPVAAPWSWRCRLGLFLLMLSLILPAFSLVLPFLGLPPSVKAGLALALFIGGPEVLAIAGVALAGKEGYLAFKAARQKIWKRVKPPQRVSPARYRLGVIVFIASGLPMWLLAYLRAATALPLDQQLVLGILIASDLAFLGSFFIAGGEFWEKLKGLFTPDPVEQSP